MDPLLLLAFISWVLPSLRTSSRLVNRWSRADSTIISIWSVWPPEATERRGFARHNFSPFSIGCGPIRAANPLTSTRKVSPADSSLSARPLCSPKGLARCASTCPTRSDGSLTGTLNMRRITSSSASDFRSGSIFTISLSFPIPSALRWTDAGQ